MDQHKLQEIERFFSSEYFTIEMLLQYLHRYRKDDQALDLLYQRLLGWDNEEICLYSPQLCCLLIKYEINQILQYFLKKSAVSLPVFFNLYWSYSAYSQMYKNSLKVENVLRQMEMAMVNGDFDESILQGKDQKVLENILIQNYELKIQKSNYFTEIQRFVGTLIRFSLGLKKFKQEDRKTHLKLFVQKTNQQLALLVNGPFRGVRMPIMQLNSDKPNSNTIVHIIEKHFVCFHTKKRVPYLILVETIDPNDFAQYQYQQEQQQVIEVEEFEESSLQDPKLEKQMAKIHTEQQQILKDALNKIVKMENKHRRQSDIWKTVDKLVQKQKIKENQDSPKQNSYRRRKHSVQNQNETFSQRKRKYSEDLTKDKSEQFYHNLAKMKDEKYLPTLQHLKQFRKKSKKILWDQNWEEQMAKYSKQSKFSHFPSYKIRPIIIKGGDDLRQELFAIQMMTLFNKIFEKADLNLYLRPYNITVTSANSGIVEYIPNTMSIDSLKKKFGNGTQTLLQIYKEVFKNAFEEAQKNFIESLASYSLFTYLLQVKDRHNGNLLIDDTGHIIHIDFGFILQTSPGGVNFESAPFKLTYEYVELMKGKDSDFFGYFKTLMYKGMLTLRKYVQEFAGLMQIMIETSQLSCFQNLDMKLWTSRFNQNTTDEECMEIINKLIYSSLYNWRTASYDNFQKKTNGILP